MTNLKMRGVRMRTETKKGKDGKERSIQVLETEMYDADAERPCKQCGKEKRQRGSSRCKKCADLRLKQISNDDRLKNKIALELKK